MPRIKVLETLAVLSFAALIFHLLTSQAWLLWLAIGLLALALFDNPLARLIARGWLAFSEQLGKVTSKIVLTLVYYLCLFPLAVMQRTLNPALKDHFCRRGKESYFSRTEKQFDARSCENPW